MGFVNGEVVNSERSIIFEWGNMWMNETDVLSIRNENEVRYLTFALYNARGLRWAAEFLSAVRRKCSAKIGVERINRNCNGIEKEIEFYASLQYECRLIPTLDAGCHFDFVGILNDRIMGVDATKSLSSKIDADKTPVVYGELEWPICVAHVKEKYVDFHSVDGSGISKDVFRCENMTGADGKIRDAAHRLKLQGYDLHKGLSVFRGRQHWLRLAYSQNDLEKLRHELVCAAGIGYSEKELLLAHMAFFNQYRFAYNLVPALSYGDGIDFVGEYAGKMICFGIMIKGVGSVEDFKTLSTAERFRIVIYDAINRTFEFKPIPDI